MKAKEVGQYIREGLTLQWWGKEMADRLEAKRKSHKHGWLDGNLQHYMIRILQCWQETVKAVSFTTHLIKSESSLIATTTPEKKQGIKDHDKITDKDVELCIKKCVDGANFFMMLADNLRNILLERGIKVGKDKGR